jgi:hypothetical protein
VIGDRDVVLALLLSGEAEMAAGLPGDLVAQRLEGLRQGTAREIPR